MKLRFIASLTVLAPLLAGDVHAAPLTPEEALARAIRRSPDLGAALADLEGARLGVLGAERQRDWLLRASLQGQYQESFSDTSQGATLNSTERIAGEVSATTTTDIGTQITVGLGTSSRWQRVNQDVGTVDEILLGPSVALDLSLDVTQPLLRGGGEDAVLASLRQARTEERLARLSRDETASQIALEVMRAYWNLWVAEQSLAVEESGYAVTARQLDDMKKKATLGTVPETDVLRLSSQEAASRQGLIAAEALVIERQFALARHLGHPLSEARALSAGSAPVMSAEPGPLVVLVALAGESSYALLSQAAQVAQAKDRVRVAADAALPRLDVWASLGAGGLWTEGPPSGLDLPGDRPAFVALVGLDFELPLGDSTADAEYAQTRAALRAAELRQSARQEALAAEVATLHRALLTAKTAAASAAETAALAGRLADKEDQRLKLGTALVSEVISAQQTFREAELSRLSAEADTVLAALELDHATGQLLTRLSLSTTLENLR
jgi:outer membrane protein TolC